MNQNNLLRRLAVIALMFTFCGLLLAPGTTYAQESGDGAIDLDNVKSIYEVDSINTYRGHLSINFSGEAFERPGTTGGDPVNVMIDSEVIKNPLALHMIMSIDENSERDNIEFITVDGITYVNINGEWQEGDSLLGDPEELLDQVNQEERPYTADMFERIGPETVNGRQTIHYRIGKESLAAASIDDAQTQILFANAEEAQLDMWIDQSENFSVKEQIVVAGKGFNENMPEASGRMEIMVEFYDFNAPITITAPSISQSEPPISPEPEPQPPTSPEPQPPTSPEPEPQPPISPEPEPPTSPEPEPEPPTSPEPEPDSISSSLPLTKSILKKAQE